MSEPIEIYKIMLKVWATVLKSSIGNAGLKKELGDKTIEKVVKRTKSGKDIGTGRVEKPIKPLAPFTIEKRQSLQQRGRLAADTTPSTSNFTETGSALSNLQSDITQNGAIVKPNNAKDIKKFKENDERRILDLTKKQTEELAEIVAKSIVSALKKL